MPEAQLSRTDSPSLGLPRRTVDAVFRARAVVVLPGYSRPMVRVPDYLKLVEGSTYRDDRLRHDVRTSTRRSHVRGATNSRPAVNLAPACLMRRGIAMVSLAAAAHVRAERCGCAVSSTRPCRLHSRLSASRNGTPGPSCRHPAA